MQRMRTMLAVLVLPFTLSACYHAIIQTGRPASSDVIEIPWAHSFIYGLVPPKVVESAAKCPNGAATVETMHSFLNGLVQAITWGIYTPITIKVTCASGGRASNDMNTIRGSGDVGKAISEAADLSVRSGAPTLVRFD
jgi:Bor protein